MDDGQWGNWRRSGLGTHCGRAALKAVRIRAKEQGCSRSSEMRNSAPLRQPRHSTHASQHILSCRIPPYSALDVRRPSQTESSRSARLIFPCPTRKRHRAEACLTSLLLSRFSHRVSGHRPVLLDCGALYHTLSNWHSVRADCTGSIRLGLVRCAGVGARHTAFTSLHTFCPCTFTHPHLPERRSDYCILHWASFSGFCISPPSRTVRISSVLRGFPSLSLGLFHSLPPSCQIVH